jgi:hypothetical protein
MGAFLGASIDLIHALLMAAWILGLPLLFWHSWPRLTRAYAFYAIAFVVANQVSFALLGECFLTTLARAGWRSASGSAGPGDTNDWFTVRVAETIFHLTPSHRSIKLVSEALILATAVGILLRSTFDRRLVRRAPARDHTRTARLAE